MKSVAQGRYVEAPICLYLARAGVGCGAGEVCVALTLVSTLQLFSSFLSIHSPFSTRSLRHRQHGVLVFFISRAASVSFDGERTAIALSRSQAPRSPRGSLKVSSLA